MLGNLYVAAKYWGWGYSDGMANAGASSSKGKRRKVMIGDEVFWARDEDLPALMQTLLTQPQEVVAMTPRMARKQARKRAKEPQAIYVARIAEIAPEARLEALESMFEAVGEDILLRSLAIAVANLAEQDDEDLLVLLV
jgi:hypothetical protein